jgi:Icc-related predicted phosphoesterase
VSGTTRSLLLASDLHRDGDACRGLVERAPEADVVVVAGDLCTMRKGLDEVVGILSAVETPTVLVPGNAESDEELRAACRGWEAAHVLHGTGTRIAGVEFFGIGGGIPVTPFGAWSWDHSEEAAEELLADLPEGAVLVTHSPPRGAADRDSSGESLGSRAVRRAVEARRPRLVVCGHIHGSQGREERIGPTPVVNAGPEGIVREVEVEVAGD